MHMYTYICMYTVVRFILCRERLALCELIKLQSVLTLDATSGALLPFLSLVSSSVHRHEAHLCMDPHGVSLFEPLHHRLEPKRSTFVAYDVDVVIQLVQERGAPLLSLIRDTGACLTLSKRHVCRSDCDCRSISFLFSSNIVYHRRV